MWNKVIMGKKFGSSVIWSDLHHSILLMHLTKETTFLPDASDNSLLPHSNDNKANYLF